MKRIILIKQHPSIQLGHLYEHLICIEIKQLFYQHGLFKYTDFALNGTTFEQGGVIEIDLELYTPKAVEITRDIACMTAPTNDAVISIAFNQLLAEEELPITVTSLDDVKRELQYLNKTPWQPIKDITIIDGMALRRRAKPIYISEGKSLSARKINISLQLDPSFAKAHRELFPLFRHLGRFVAYTSQDQLTIDHGYYANEVYFALSSAHIPQMRIELSVANGHDEEVVISKLSDTCIATVNYMLENHGPQRLIHWLSSVSYEDSPSSAPDPYASFNDTGVYIGSAGWQTIASKENIEKLLQYTSIDIRFGRKRTHRKILLQE